MSQIADWDKPKSKGFAGALLALLLVLTMGLAAAAYLYLSYRQTEARRAAHRELSAIADLKLHQISNWREERIADANFFAHARFVAQDVQRFLDKPDSPEARAALLHWLKLLQGGERYYSVTLFDPQLKPRLGLPDALNAPTAHTRAQVQQALQQPEVVLSDLHREETNGPIQLDILIPIRKEGGARQAPALAVVLLRLDARQFLFPLIQSWPIPRQTAETLLVRQEGREVVFLNDLRHRQGTALTLRLPLNSLNLPAAKVLRGDTKMLEGIDYRGVPVVATGRMIPGTPWGIVAKVDREEIYAPLRQQTVAVVLAVSALVLAAVLLAALLWRQRTTRFLQWELALEKERAALAERVTLLMRSANDIILLFDLQGRVLEANDYALRHYGYTLAEIQQKTLQDLRAPEGRLFLERDLGQVTTTGDVAFETVHQRKDGTSFSVEVHSRKVNWGTEILLLSIIRDITERKAHELEIQRLNRLYAALSQINQAVVRARSREELLEQMCQVLVQFGGVQMAWVGWVDPISSQVLPIAQCGDGDSYLERIRVFADNRAEGQGPVGTAIREGRPCVCNDALSAPGMQAFREAAARSGWRALAAFPIRQEGCICGALAVYARQQDFFGVQEQALIEEAAEDVSFGLDTLLNDQRRRQAEEQSRLQVAALQSAANAIVITNREGIILWVNAAFERLTGYSASEVVGQTPRVIKSDRQAPEFFRGMWEAILAGRVWRGELVNQRRDGSLYYEEMTVTPVRSPQGELTHFIAIKQDISDRKQAEAALRQARDELARANADLERKVSERTAQLVEANANLQTFTYTAAHDLRSPLRSIKNFSSLVLEESGAQLGADSRFMLERVTASADQMAKLLDDLLEYSKMSQAELELEPVSLRTAIDQALALLEGDIRAKGAQVTVSEPMLEVMGHPATVVLIVNNLVSNALKFIPLGVSPQIRLWAEKSTDHVRLSVQDNGIGIAPEHREKIFEIFQRLHSKQAYSGTGLGLALVRKGAERMGGRVGVESEPGRGSRFWLELKAV